MRSSLVALAAAALVVTPALAEAQRGARARAPKPTGTDITAADLASRLAIFADDSMQGRAAGTPGHDRAADYLAAELRKLGLQPAGEDGGYFQTVPLVRRVAAETSTLETDAGRLALWTDWIPTALTGRLPDAGAPVLFGGRGDSAAALTREQVAGKFVVFTMPEGRPGFASPVAANPTLQAAAGIGIVLPEAQLAQLAGTFRRPRVGLPATTAPSALVQVVLTPAAAQRLLGNHLDSTRAGMAGRVVRGRVEASESPAPSRNVVAVLPGTDARLRGSYVAVGAHSDHIGTAAQAVDHDSARAVAMTVLRWQLANPGTRMPPAERAAIRVNMDSLRAAKGPARRDSINNGADDDGSGSVAVLEMAERFARGRGDRPKRSMLFVWHTAEENGLLGARWFTDRPTVPRDSIVAQLNIDMVGRGGTGEIAGGGPSYLQVIGSRRLSTQLGNLVEQVNRGRRNPFTFDYSWDADGHPENIYCRSDHYMYARYGIPVTFFTTGLHQDYHRVTDEAQYVDFAHMADVAGLVFDVAKSLANDAARPVVDKPKPDPNGSCRQ